MTLDDIVKKILPQFDRRNKSYFEELLNGNLPDENKIHLIIDDNDFIGYYFDKKHPKKEYKDKPILLIPSIEPFNPGSVNPYQTYIIYNGNYIHIGVNIYRIKGDKYTLLYPGKTYSENFYNYLKNLLKSKETRPNEPGNTNKNKYQQPQKSKTPPRQDSPRPPLDEINKAIDTMNKYIRIMNEDIDEVSKKTKLIDQDKLNCTQLKKLYKWLSLKFHPDKHPNSPNEYKSKFQEIGNAYTTLLKIVPKTT